MFEFRDELKIFLSVVKPELAVYFSDSKLIAGLAYLVDIFDSLNTKCKNARKRKKYYSLCGFD